MFGLASRVMFVATSVILHPSSADSAPGTKEVNEVPSPEQTADKDGRFAAGVRLGLFPPVFSAPELGIRPLDHIALGVYGIYLPGESGGKRFMLAGSMTFEIAERHSSGPYISLGFLYYHAIKDSHGNYETWTAAPATAGYLFRGGNVELQLGLGVQVIRDELPPCQGWFCFRYEGPPILPAVDFGLRYVF